MSELLILSRAEADVLEVQARLEEVLPGLGNRFNARAEEALDRLLVFPESGPVYSAPFRRLLIRDFPHGIFYIIEGRRIVVHAVLDLRQVPRDIARRLGLR
jgi:plasmid stabilization system protein ParE